MKPTIDQIARDYALWGEYVDRMAVMTRAEFEAMTVTERIALITATFQED